MKKKLLVIYLSLATIGFAQSFGGKRLLPRGLRLSNQLEYTHDVKRKLEIMENWLNLDYHSGIFSAGFRFDAFQPNDPDPSISRGKEKFAGIDYKYIEAKLGRGKKSLKLTAGNFYTLFGRGMILKSYEDRSIRVDNNLLGVKVEGRYNNLKFTALSGSAENSKAERKDILHTADVEYRFGSPLTIGGTYALNLPANSNSANTSIMSLRASSHFSLFDVYTEYGLKQNKDIAHRYFNDSETFTGKAFYGNVNFYLNGFSLSGEYKYYDNFAFTSSDGTVFYNTPPSLRKDYTFTLLNRHPSTLDANNEQGFQLEANYSLDEFTSFQISYGLTKTLPSSSLYKRMVGSKVQPQTQLDELYLQAEHEWENKFYLLLACGINQEATSSTKNFTPVMEGRYFIDETNTLRLSIEHQQTHNTYTDEKYFSDVALVEWQHAPKLSLSVLAEMRTSEPTPNHKVRKIWSFFQIAYKLGETTDVSLLVGSRHAGHICIGGVCRYEPEFNGVELKMLTRLY